MLSISAGEIVTASYSASLRLAYPRIGMPLLQTPDNIS
jgi:hypothetical protein